MKAFNRGIAKSFMLVALLIGASAAGAGAPAVEVGQRTISLRHADLASAAGAKEVWRLVRRAATEICGSSW